jgi:hypothetical protein
MLSNENAQFRVLSELRTSVKGSRSKGAGEMNNAGIVHEATTAVFHQVFSTSLSVEFLFTISCLPGSDH